MTPAINAAKQANLMFTIHPYEHESANGRFGKEAAEKLGVSPDQLFKTLLIILDNKTFIVSLVPVSQQLDLKRCATVLGAKKAKMAAKKDVERITGYLPGGVSPIAQKKNLKTLIDKSAMQYATIYVSAGRRGLQIELSPMDLKKITDGQIEYISKTDGTR